VTIGDGSQSAHYDSRGVFIETWVLDVTECDYPVALVLSQVLWWHQPSKDGTPRCKFERAGQRWLLRSDDEWWGETRLSLRQVRRAKSVLTKAELVECRRFKRDIGPTTAWRPVFEAIQRARILHEPDPEVTRKRQFRSDAPTSVGSDAQASVPSSLVTYELDLETSRKLSNEIARSEWDRRNPKPVCGFLALRARIGEALAAGHSPEAVTAALRTMTVFSRNSFDFALGAGKGRAVLPANDRPENKVDRDLPGAVFRL